MNEAKLEISKINSNKLKLGIPPILGVYFFPIYIDDLLKEGFAEYIEFVETGSLAMKELLLTGKVDISLIASLSQIMD